MAPTLPAAACRDRLGHRGHPDRRPGTALIGRASQVEVQHQRNVCRQRGAVGPSHPLPRDALLSSAAPLMFACTFSVRCKSSDSPLFAL